MGINCPKEGATEPRLDPNSFQADLQLAERGLEQQYVLASFDMTFCESEANWIMADSLTDRTQTANVALFARPMDLLNLFFACTNRPLNLSRLPQGTLPGTVAKTWFFLHENRDLLQYLLDLGALFDNWGPWNQESSWSLKTETKPNSDDAVVFDLLRSKSETFLQTWKTLTEDKSHHVTAEILQILVSFCVVSSIYGAFVPQQPTQKMQELQVNCQALWSGICHLLEAHGSNFVLPCLELISPILPSISGSESTSAIWAGLRPLVAPLAAVLEKTRQNQKDTTLASGDFMDLDDQLSSDRDGYKDDQTILSMNRQYVSFFSDAGSFQRCSTVQLSLLLRLYPDSMDTETLNNPTLAGYLDTLEEADILAARHVLPDAYGTCKEMDREQLLHVLEDIGEKCLQSYEMERCEASHGVCIRMMGSLVGYWTDAQSDDLNNSAIDLYGWFIEVLIKRKRASPRVLITLSELIRAVLDLSPSYGSTQSLSSPRTSLFTILHEGDAQVKFSVANFVPTLFERFLLKDHDVIFDDVLDSLPRDPDWIEGIALRLFVLSRLASEWHTLLRRSIYHMFETPAQVPSSLKYARKCIVSVSKALGLQDGRQLFRLFASQILYTWTETKSLDSIPFSIFGYASLKDLLEDVQDEVVGQMMMRGKVSQIEHLAKLLAKPQSRLLQTSFFKVEAYSISRDISTPPDQGSQPKGVEIHTRKLLGPEEFMIHIEKQFPQIIATLFKSVDQYDQIDRAYSKRPAFRYALDIQTKITSKCRSLSPLPANQQPSFRARYLLDELEFVCKRAGFEVESIWTPALASFVCRSLLESIHPALGSLHTCSVIRKIRILVCLAGPVMIEEYPFEMLLHALCPFLVDIHCCEDAMGIIWYLLDAGNPYMMVNPGFTAGILISIFVTLRKLLKSSPDSTTQETQFRAVLASAQRFYEWLCDLAGEYRSEDWGVGINTSISQLLSLAKKLSAPNNRSAGQQEKELVLAILKDRDSTRSLLTKSIGDPILALLCPEFKKTSPEDGSESNNHLDSDSESHIVSLWDTLDRFDDQPEYSLWAARLLGRHFAATGKIDESLLREQDLSLFKSIQGSDSLDDFCQSKARIIQILCAKLPSQNHLEASLIEHTLQLIIKKITDVSDLQGCAEVIPESLMNSLIFAPYSCPEMNLSESELEVCNQPIRNASGLSVNDWARNVSLSLSGCSVNDPVMGSLQKTLNVIPGLAVQLLPYIVHDVLLFEEENRAQIRQDISDAFKQVLNEACDDTMPHARIVINCILYLRTQPFPDESTIAERDAWLDIDFGEASAAAHRCGMQKTALLFLEIQASKVISGSRRSSVATYTPPLELLHDIFKNVDDPDLFYGIQQSSSLSTVMERLEYEGSGFKNLLFQSAQYDSEIQITEQASPVGVLRALNATNLQGIANTMLSSTSGAAELSFSSDSMLQGATSLQQWDIPVSPLNSSPSATVFRALQSLNTSSSVQEMFDCIDHSLLTSLKSLTDTGRSAIQIRTAMRGLGIMTEMSDVIRSKSSEEVAAEWKRILDRSAWLKTER